MNKSIIVLVLFLTLGLSGCAGMSQTEQRTMSGTMGGAGAGPQRHLPRTSAQSAAGYRATLPPALSGQGFVRPVAARSPATNVVSGWRMLPSRATCA